LHCGGRFHAKYVLISNDNPLFVEMHAFNLCP
jgi:hypothetical protein